MKIKSFELVVLFCIAGSWGCMDSRPTGALEPTELYNTSGIPDGSLFDEDGLAPVSYAEQAFLRVGFMWDAEEGCLLEGRLLDLSGRWSDWKPIEARWSEGIARSGHLDAHGLAVGFQLRHSAGPAPTHLMAEAIELIGEPVVPEADDQPYSELQQALAPSSLVNSRSSWGARSPRCTSSSHSPSKVTVHHTATPLPDSMSPAARLRQMQNYHMNSLGWCDIGYHFLVDWNGEMWQGRNETRVGAHVANNNTNNVGISFMGTYTSKSATGSQLNACAALLAWMNDRYSIPLRRTYIKGHRQYGGTACPGNRLYGQLDDLVARANDDPGQDPAKGTLKGVVFEDTGAGTDNMDKRIPGATIQASGGGSATARDGDALWSLSLSPGTYTVTASADGYQDASRSCSVQAGGETWCSLGLVPDGDDPGGDPVETGLVSGYVVELADPTDPILSDNPPVADAKVRSDCGASTTTDSTGHFELEVDAGTRVLSASAQGYGTAAASCSVSEGGETECYVPIIPKPPADPDDPADPPDDPEEPVVTGGCSTAGDAGSFLALLLPGLLVLRRRRRTTAF